MAVMAVAAVIGLSGGAVTAFFTQPEDLPDPLGLGIPMVNVGCTGEALMIVGRGNDARDLRDSVVDFDAEGARYLEPAKSCDTAYPPYEGAPATYAVYLSGYADTEAACTVRMRNDHKSDMVTVMRAGNTDAVMCPCELDRTSLPEIGGEGLDVTTESAMWTSAYQNMLIRAGSKILNDPKQVTGQFDKVTLDATRAFQAETLLPPLGKVTTDTWVQLRSKACRTYNY
ncbi:hypothetical protein GCM10009843_37740 [Nocardioides bigeumensis]|jgi:hypothetical protein|uniref:Peptidoglycan binding-like domain-containing protein n=2 Tax=Nocardioides bigeumensis TaxID=433657 RepID=A0ABP5KP43_9ACTN